MMVPTLIMGILSVIFIVIGYFKGANQHIEGLRLSLNMFIETLQLLVFAFILAGMIQVLIPKDIVFKWLGRESGLRGIIIGTLLGGLCPGGPYVSLPIVAGLLRAGASFPTCVAFLTSWLLWSLSRLPMEVGILGWRFTLVRFASTFLFPPVAGLIAQLMTGAK